METATGRHGEDLDPRAQLAMLDNVRVAAEAEAWMTPTPIWHAPLLATAFAGLHLVYDGRDYWADIGAVVGFLAIGLAMADQIRRQRVVPKRLGKPRRALMFYGVMAVVTVGVIVLWSQVELPDRSARAALALLGGWLATTTVFALGITTTNRLHNRWTASPR